MTYIFLDTNSLIHYQDFESIRWPDIIKDNDYAIVICPQVLKEVNIHKDSSKGKRRERAKTINRKLTDILKKKSQSKVNVVFCKGPSRNSCESADFNPLSQDDWIVYALNDFDSEGNRKILISNDNGLYLRCQDLGVECIDLPDKYAFQLDPTDEEIENRQLKKQIKELIESKPILELLFHGEKKELSYQLVSDEGWETLIDNYRSKLMEKFPHKVFKRYRSGILGSTSFDVSTVMGENAIQEDDVETYNSEIDEYIDELCEIEKNRIILNAFDGNVHRLNLMVANQGSVMSGEMRVCLYFPDGMRIYSKDSRCKVDVTLPTEPKLSTKFQKQLNEDFKKKLKLNEMMKIPMGYYPTTPNGDYEEHWNQKDYLKNVNPLTLTAEPLMHYFSETITNREDIYFAALYKGDYTIKWTIVDSTCPYPFSGELTIHII